MTLFDADRELQRATNARTRLAIRRGDFVATDTLRVRPGDLVQRDDAPPQIETSIEALGRSWLTPNELFFVRSHHPAPEIDLARWRLDIRGLVHRPVVLTLDALRAIGHVECVCTLECAGNGRSLMPGDPAGVPWRNGAVGTALWGGVRLGDLLEAAGVRPEARHVWFETADGPRDPEAPRYQRSLPIEKAMQDVLLAHAMNGRALPPIHGAPLRAIVPGWYGMASAKWLTDIRVESEPCSGHYMTTAYRYVHPPRSRVADSPVDRVRVKSLITGPLEGAEVRRGLAHARGIAWGGSGGVGRIEVSGDGGRNWTPGHLVGGGHDGAWRAWEAWIELPRAGRATLAARATDAAGATQPLRPIVNAGGYGNNAVHRVSVLVVDPERV